jgi:hypothetical protein
LFTISTTILLFKIYFKKLGESRHSGGGESAFKWYLNTCALYLWFAVFFLQSHKEERFLYPVYPLIALMAACAVDAAQKIAFRNVV